MCSIPSGIHSQGSGDFNPLFLGQEHALTPQTTSKLSVQQRGMGPKPLEWHVAPPSRSTRAPASTSAVAVNFVRCDRGGGSTTSLNDSSGWLSGSLQQHAPAAASDVYGPASSEQQLALTAAAAAAELKAATAGIAGFPGLGDRNGGGAGATYKRSSCKTFST